MVVVLGGVEKMALATTEAKEAIVIEVEGMKTLMRATKVATLVRKLNSQQEEKTMTTATPTLGL